MRKTNQEIKDEGIMEEILTGAQICRIAMMDGDMPYLLPFNFGYRDRCIYIHSAPGGKKIKLLKRNNRVCFEVEGRSDVIPAEKACSWATLYRSVVGYGTVEVIADTERKRESLEIIMKQHGAPGDQHFDPHHMDRMVILKLTITSMTGKQSSNWGKVSTQEPPGELT